MKVLLLHPADDPARMVRGRYDLIVDLGWAPDSAYRDWSEKLGCAVISLKSGSRATHDLAYLRQLLDPGRAKWLDAGGVDWWEVLSMMIHPELHRLALAVRLGERIRGCKELTATRGHLVVSALGRLMGLRPSVLEAEGMASRTGRRFGALVQFRRAQLLEIAYDKYDPCFALRRRFAPARPQRSVPVVLLPSAYVNVTRTELACARLLPGQKFLLITSRNSGRVSPLPANVTHVPLASYAVSPKKWRDEAAHLRQQWNALETELRAAAVEFRLAAELGLFARMAGMLDWGLALREAWREVFTSENVVGCLSADEGNPATRLPLMLAAQRGIPTVACHHGALDCGVALRRSIVNTHLVQSAMERDYALNVCRANDLQLIEGALSAARGSLEGQNERRLAPWLAFFTEPYEIDGGRVEEIYREVIPRLCQVAREKGKRVMLKLHPFESAKMRQRQLARVLAPPDLASVEVVSEPLSPELWKKVWCLVTIQSTVAVEASALGIPVFLLGWLAAPWTGYAAQFAKFGVGRLLCSPDQMNLIADADQATARAAPPTEPITSDALAEALMSRSSPTPTFAAPAGA
jgi:hypothetical protein